MAEFSKLKDGNIPHLIEDMVKNGIEAKHIQKLEKVGLDLKQLGKMVSAPVNEELIAAMKEAEKDTDLLDQLNSAITKLQMDKILKEIADAKNAALADIAFMKQELAIALDKIEKLMKK
jgi:ABC-type amino acid transport substrate-binding protein